MTHQAKTNIRSLFSLMVSIEACISFPGTNVSATARFFVSDGRTDNTGENNDNLFGRGWWVNYINLFPELLRTLTDESDDHPWYFGALNREGAERYLVLDYNVQGSFLVRESVRYPGSFVVSLKDYDHAEEKFKIRHIKISCARGTYRYNHKSYQTLSSLVDKASKDKIFSSPLTNPCLILRSHHPEMVGDSDTCDTTEDEIEFGSAISLAPPTGILVSGRELY